MSLDDINEDVKQRSIHLSSACEYHATKMRREDIVELLRTKNLSRFQMKKSDIAGQPDKVLHMMLVDVEVRESIPAIRTPLKPPRELEASAISPSADDTKKRGRKQTLIPTTKILEPVTSLKNSMVLLQHQADFGVVNFQLREGVRAATKKEKTCSAKASIDTTVCK
jgi:hypothetical protein